ncbi:hypothetical protein EGM51_08880 [Verrucomicrobia bacterium S94]|nr:hypothetical protein EGM51_08880 [Verrucomicrobia bacterium S94]
MNNCCPICASKNLDFCFTHEKWKVPCLKCGDCSHVFASEHIEETEDSFTTNQQRADFYLHYIKSLCPAVMMDIGTPADFYILKSAKSVLPEICLYALDLYEKEHPPYVTLLNNFPETPVDLTTAFHVLEHVPDPKPFIHSLISSSQHFIIEVPDCSSIEKMRRSSTKPHTHFFSADSLTRLLSSFSSNVQVAVRYGAGIPLKMSSIMAYSLPNDLTIPADSRSISNFLPRLLLSQYLLHPLKKS